MLCRFGAINRLVLFNCVNPETWNVDKIVALFDIELYELISYMPELFIILFMISQFRIKKYSKLIYIMAQIYSPNVVGKQISIDVKNMMFKILKVMN